MFANVLIAAHRFFVFVLPFISDKYFKGSVMHTVSSLYQSTPLQHCIASTNFHHLASFNMYSSFSLCGKVCLLLYSRRVWVSVKKALSIQLPGNGTGSFNHHSTMEFANAQQMDKLVDVVVDILEI